MTIIKGFDSDLGALSIAFVIGEWTCGFLPALGALGLGFVAYGLSIWLYIRAQRYIGATRTSAYYALSPFIGAGLSLIAIDLGEPPTPLFWIALAIMAMGTVVVTQDSLKA